MTNGDDATRPSLVENLYISNHGYATSACVAHPVHGFISDINSRVLDSVLEVEKTPELPKAGAGRGAQPGFVSSTANLRYKISQISQ